MIRGPAALACARRLLDAALEDNPERVTAILTCLAATMIQNATIEDEEAQEREKRRLVEAGR